MTFGAVCHAKYREFLQDFIIHVSNVIQNVVELHRNGLNDIINDINPPNLVSGHFHDIGKAVLITALLKLQVTAQCFDFCFHILFLLEKIYKKFISYVKVFSKL